MNLFPNKIDLSKAKVYKYVASGFNNKLAMLVGIISNNPEKVLENYLKHATVSVVENPTYLPDTPGDLPGIDLYLTDSKEKPFYKIMNRLEQSTFEGILTADTKLRP